MRGSAASTADVGLRHPEHEQPARARRAGRRVRRVPGSRASAGRARSRRRPSRPTRGAAPRRVVPGVAQVGGERAAQLGIGFGESRRPFNPSPYEPPARADHAVAARGARRVRTVESHSIVRSGIAQERNPQHDRDLPATGTSLPRPSAVRRGRRARPPDHARSRRSCSALSWWSPGHWPPCPRPRRRRPDTGRSRPPARPTHADSDAERRNRLHAVARSATESFVRASSSRSRSPFRTGRMPPPLPIAVTLSLGSTPLRDRAALSAWLAGGADGGSRRRSGSATVAAVASGGEETSGIVIAPGDPVLQIVPPASIPSSRRLRVADGPVELHERDDRARRRRPSRGRASAWSFRSRAGATDEGLLTADELAELTAPTGSLSNQLNAVEGTSAILAVDPAIPAAIRVLGTSAPASATEWLDAARRARRSRDSRCSSATRMSRSSSRPGCRARSRPLSLSSYMNPADFVPDGRADTRRRRRPARRRIPTRRSTPTSQLCSTSAAARAGVFWPARAPRPGHVVAALGGLTVDDQTRSPSCPPPPRCQGAYGATVAARRAAPATPTCSSTTPTSRVRCTRRRSTDENALRGAPLTAATAYLAFAVAETGGEPAAGGPRPRRAIAPGSALRRRSRPPRRPRASPRSPWARLAASDPAAVEIADAAADPARVGAASALLADESELSRFATILDDIEPHHRARARGDPPAARHRVAARSGRRGRPRSTCIAPSTATTLDSRGSAPAQHDQPVRRRAPISDSGCATTCPIPSTSSCTRHPTTSGSTCSARPRSSPAPSSNTRVRGAGAGAGRQRRGDARTCSCAAARASPIGEARTRRGQRARRVGERRHHRAVARRRRLLVLGVVRTVLRDAARRQAEAARGDARMPRRPTTAAADAVDADAGPTDRDGRPGARPMSGIGRASVLIGAGHDRLAPERLPARGRPRLGRRRDDRGGQRLRDREPAAQQHLRDHLDGPADRRHRAADRQGGRARRRRPGLRLEALHPRHGRAAGASTVLATIAAPWLVQLYAPGFPPDQQALATAFAYWCLPQILFYGLYALVGEALNARRVFGPFTWAPIVNNVVSIAGFLVVHRALRLGWRRRRLDARR